MKRFNSEHIQLLHSILLEETGGLDGVRDENMFESAANSPFQTFDGIYMYSTSERKAARRGFSLIKNHPFIDGNKRIGVMTVLAFLELNGIVIDCSEDELIQIGLAVADGTMDDEQLLQWTLDHEN